MYTIEIVDIFLRNFNFIFLNSFLALVPVIFGWLMLKPFSKFVRILCGFIWFIFLPNTIYILTDMSHLSEDWPKVDGLFRLILIIQYFLFLALGIVSFVISIYFFHLLLEGKSLSLKLKKIRLSTFFAIFVLNFLVGFAVVMGGIERTNSWHILTDPTRVTEDIFNVTSSKEKLILAGGIGILANLIYFLSFKSVVSWGKKYLKL